MQTVHSSTIGNIVYNTIELAQYGYVQFHRATIATVHAGQSFRSYCEDEWGYDQVQAKRYIQENFIRICTAILICVSLLFVAAKAHAIAQYGDSDFFGDRSKETTPAIAEETGSVLSDEQVIQANLLLAEAATLISGTDTLIQETDALLALGSWIPEVM